MNRAVEIEEEEDFSKINMTPLVDVSLALVLIFMVTVPFSIIHGITVKRQLLEKFGLTTPQENVVVRLNSQGTFIQDENGVFQNIPYENFGMVLSQMLQISPSGSLILQAARDVPHGQTVWVFDLAKQNGARDVSLMETQ